MKKLAARESSEFKSTVNCKAAFPTIRALQDVTVVLIVAVDGASLARSVAIQWHHSRKVHPFKIDLLCRARSIGNALLTG
jgi:hypothetical protein